MDEDANVGAVAGERGAGSGRAPGVDDRMWARLRAEAREAMLRAYCPYSRYPVGAAALVDDGRVVTGCNVENAALGVTLCAECGVVSRLIDTGGGRLVAIACADARGRATAPCGRCRQLLWEHGGPDLLVDMPGGVAPMRDVLPGAFGPATLDQVPGARGRGRERG